MSSPVTPKRVFSSSQSIVTAKPHSYLSPMQQFLNFGLRLKDYNAEIKVL
jgi:hypothetical protein